MPGIRTQLCGIYLHPSGHTRSPAMHNAAYRALSLDAVYLAFDVLPDRLGAAIEGARALGIRQLSISLPHKEAVAAHLDRIDETALRIGAVNTVTRVGDELVGSNTDWSGAMRALESELELAGCRAVVLGAGGTARALTYGLVLSGAQVHVLNRTRERAERLAADLGAAGGGALGDLAALDYDLLVNTTSVGLRSELSPVPAEHLRRDRVVMDAIYDPPNTRLLREAAARGCRTLGGKWMLVHQAALQIESWSGLVPPLDVLSAAFDAD